MKSKVRILALLTALLVAFSLCAAAEEETSERVILMTVGGVPVYQDEVEYYAYLTQMYYQYGYMDYYFNNLDSLQYVIFYDVAANLLTEGRVEELLGEKYDGLYAEHGETFDRNVDERVADIKAEEGYSGTDEEAYEEALAYFSSIGYTREAFIQGELARDAYEVYLENLPVDISDERVSEVFLLRSNQDREMYQDNLAMYEYYVMRNGYESYYMPEGYRGILHILLEADDELLSAYSSAADGEEKEAAAAAVVASVQDTVDAIYTAYENGTPFVDLIAQYNTDPGMTNEEYLANGYQVHRDSSNYVQEFTDGAFSEGMDAPGDISKPVVTNYGVHILYYLSDIPGGAIEMTDEIKASIRDELASEDRYNQVIELLRQYEVVYNPVYDTVIGEKNFLDD